VGETIDGTSDDDALFGFGGDDTLNGLGGDDLLDGGTGNDTIDGGANIDRAIYAGMATITAAATGFTVTDSGGTDTLINVEIVDDEAPGRTLLVGNGGFTTIQEAVDAAEDGDTIQLAPGFYDEVVTVNKDVTIRGANAGIPGYGTRGTESEVTSFIVTADGVTIDGVLVSGTSQVPGFAFPAGVNVLGDDFTLINSVVDLEGEDEPSQFVAGLLTTEVTGLEVANNKFADYGIGAYTSGAGTTGSIHDNLFQGDSSDPEAPTGMANGVNSETSMVLIEDNTFDGLYAGVINLFPFGPETVDLNTYVMGNVFTDNQGSQPIQVYPTSLSHNFIGTDENETFHGDTTGSDPVSFDGRGGEDRIFGGGGNDTLSGGDDNDLIEAGAGNDTLNGGDGDDTLRGQDGDDVINGGAGNDTIDGGDGNDTVVFSGPVTITGTSTGFTVTDANGDTDTVTNVEAIENDGADGRTLLVGNGGFATIQAAVDAAEDGDTIVVAPGSYDENVVVNKDVTIRGANAGIPGSGTRGPETEVTSFNITANGVTLDGVQVTGYQQTENSAFPAGINVSGDDFTLINSLIDLEGENQPSLFVAGLLTTEVTGLEVANNEFADYGIGIYVSGGGSTGSIHDNLFQGDSSDPEAPTGMANGVNSETSKVLIKDNTFDGIYAGVINLFPFGPETVDLNTYVMGNVFTDNVAVRPIQIYPTSLSHNFIGTDENETFNGDAAGNEAVSFDGRGGNDSAYGGGGDDTLSGGAGDDLIESGAGNDTLDGGTGNDTMRGGTGNDIYFVDSFDDVVEELPNEGTDEVRTAIGSKTDYTRLYVLPANVENLTGTSTTGQGVIGNELNNVITMGSGNDLVVLHDGGDDTVRGGNGNDFFYYGGAFTNGDSNDGGAGVDTIGLVGNYNLTFDADDLVSIEQLRLFTAGPNGPAASYNLTTIDANVAAGVRLFVNATSLAANETLVFNGTAETDGSFAVQGGAGSDVIAGGARGDFLSGNAGADELYGLGGNDTLIGGGGADLLRGGGGRDFFTYLAVSDSTFTEADTIADFQSQVDKIDLSAIDANNNAADGNTAFTYIGAAEFSGQAGELRAYEAVAGTWFVVGDTDGDGVGDLYIQVKTVLNQPLVATDFVF
jgi:Ca2+-binding RTX toxin-like protein